MKWDRANLILLAILTPVALLLGWYETRGIEIKKEKSHKNKTEYEYMIKRGTPYAVGWTLTFVLGIALHAWFAKEKILNMFSEAIWDNLIEELNPFAIFLPRIRGIYGFERSFFDHIHFGDQIFDLSIFKT